MNSGSQFVTHPTWRITAGMAIAQAPGVTAGLMIEPLAEDWFMNAWYGGAFAMPFGFVLGLLWQIHTSVTTLVEFRWHVLFYGLFAALLPTAGALSFSTWAQLAPA